MALILIGIRRLLWDELAGGTFLGSLGVILMLPDFPVRDWEKLIYARL
jgi:hypothetical protein